MYSLRAVLLCVFLGSYSVYAIADTVSVVFFVGSSGLVGVADGITGSLIKATNVTSSLCCYFGPERFAITTPLLFKDASASLVDNRGAILVRQEFGDISPGDGLGFGWFNYFAPLAVEIAPGVCQSVHDPSYMP